MNLAVNLTVKLARLHLGHLKMNTFAKKWYNGGRCWRCLCMHLKFVYCALENPSMSLLCVEERESDVVGKLINISVGSLKELSAIPLWQHQQASGTFFNSCEDMCGHVRTCDGTWGHVRTCEDRWGHLRTSDGMWRHMRTCEDRWGHVRRVGRVRIILPFPARLLHLFPSAFNTKCHRQQKCSSLWKHCIGSLSLSLSNGSVRYSTSKLCKN